MTRDHIGDRKSEYQRISELAEACRTETEQHLDNGACFELLRQALEDANEDAWQAIHNQYNQLVMHWIRESTHYPLSNEFAEDLAQTAWLKFWQQLSSQKPPFSRRFSHIGAALSYLHKCAITACLTWHRKRQMQERVLTEVSKQINDEFAISFIQDYLQKIDVMEKVDLIRKWIDENIQDDAESIVIRLTYQHQLTPAEIVQQRPHLFTQELDVYRIKQRVLRRAQRALMGNE